MLCKSDTTPVLRSLPSSFTWDAASSPWKFPLPSRTFGCRIEEESLTGGNRANGGKTLFSLFPPVQFLRENENSMSDSSLRQVLSSELDAIRQKGLFKQERQLLGPQGAAIRVANREVINFCANNYLGLANHPAVVAAAQEGLRRYGYGMASVRFICGTQDLHKQLERAIAEFLQKDDAILYSSCFDA